MAKANGNKTVQGNKTLAKNTRLEVIAEICKAKKTYREYHSAWKLACENSPADSVYKNNKSDEQNLAHWFCHSASEYAALAKISMASCKNFVMSLNGVMGRNNELHRIQKKAIEFFSNEIKGSCKVNDASPNNMTALITFLTKAVEKANKKPAIKTPATETVIETPAIAVNEA